MSDAQPSASDTLNGRILNVRSDMPDLRDRVYEPSLLDLKLALNPPSPSCSPILDQGQEGACTGFALASAINLQNNMREAQLGSQSIVASLPSRVSPRMLYEMAKLHDEWPDEDYEGSSIRGALKGFFHNGACDEALAPYVSGEKNWYLTKEQAQNARRIGLGAYYRLRPEIIDYHAALNEVGVVYVSASVHRGWQNPRRGIIKQSNIHEGGHAFIIVGYNENGFLVQNSWGSSWGGFQGHNGVAEWSYADWAENVMDAWVLRLAVPTPDCFDLTHIPKSSAEATVFQSNIATAPKRSEIVGHFIHIDDVCESLRFVLKKKFEKPINISSGKKINLVNICKLINKFYFKKKVVFDLKKGEDLVGDNSQLRSLGKKKFKSINQIVKSFKK